MAIDQIYIGTKANGTTQEFEWRATEGIASVVAVCKSDAVVTLTIEESSDHSTVDRSTAVTVRASTDVVRVFSPSRAYVRITVANASGGNAAIRAELKLSQSKIDPSDVLPEPAPREHRLITVADVATEVAETGATSWVGAQAIAARATTSDAIGCYKRNSTGTSGVEVQCFWVDTDGAVVYSAMDIEIRPVTKWTVGAATRIGWAAASRTAPPGSIMDFLDTAPGPMWFKVIAATSPGGATTHLQINVREVNR